MQRSSVQESLDITNLGLCFELFSQKFSQIPLASGQLTHSNTKDLKELILMAKVLLTLLELAERYSRDTTMG